MFRLSWKTPYKIITVTLSDKDFQELRKWADRNFQPEKEFNEFVKRLYYKYLPLIHVKWISLTTKSPRKLLPTLQQFRAFLVNSIEEYHVERVEVPPEPPYKLYRVQYTVLFYGRVEEDELILPPGKRRTPSPFLESRAWIIVDRETLMKERNKILRELKYEAFFNPWLLRSVYLAFLNCAIDSIESFAGQQNYAEWIEEEKRKLAEAEEELTEEQQTLKSLFEETRHITMAREAYEIREEFHEPVGRIRRAMAVYKYDYDDWYNAYKLYDNAAIVLMQIAARYCAALKHIDFDTVKEQTYHFTMEIIDSGFECDICAYYANEIGRMINCEELPLYEFNTLEALQYALEEKGLL